MESEGVRGPRAALLAAFAAAPCAAAAQDAPHPAPAGGGAPPSTPSLPEKLGEVPGTWDLSRDGTNRRCVMTLMLESGDAGRRLHFPAGCRRALPVVSGVAGWLFTDGAVRLVDRNVRPILQFARRPDQRSLGASAESGESYSFVPLDIVAMRPAVPATPDLSEPAGGPPPAPLQTAPTVPAELRRSSSADEPAAPNPAPGVYALDRFQERDTCRVAFDGAGGGVHIVPGCRDGGLEVFDPVRWRYARGRLTLTAKRGHSIDLVPSGDGRWRRDPEVGTTFVLRRIDP